MPGSRSAAVFDEKIWIRARTQHKFVSLSFIIIRNKATTKAARNSQILYLFKMAALAGVAYVTGIVGCLVLFLILNFTLGAPAEYCYGSDNCAVNCVPTGALVTSMCREEHCGSSNPGTLTCIQTFVTAANTIAQCNCMESMQCNFAADSRFSNLSLVFLLFAMVFTHNLLNLRSAKSTAGAQSAV